MPSLDDSIALQIDTIERDIRVGVVGHASVLWLISTLRREMATTQALRGRLERIEKGIERLHALGGLRRPTLADRHPIVVDEP
jgi:hypothetical protein